MTTSSDETRASRILDGLSEVIQAGAEDRDPEDLDAGLNMVFARIAAGRTKRRKIVRSAALGVAVLACTVVALRFTSNARQHPRAPELAPLVYQIEGGNVLEGGYLHESGHSGITLSFNEGSKFILMPGTRGRLRTVDREGARLAIENGKAAFQVTPNSDRRWSVEVGPFLVTVKGTVFSVSWSPSDERFELKLRRGLVTVSGPMSGGSIALRAGQRLVVNLPKAEALITEERSPTTSEDASEASSPALSDQLSDEISDKTLDKTSDETVPDDVRSRASRGLPPGAFRPSAARERLARHSPSPAPLSSVVAKTDGERRWSDELANGRWDTILEQVERTGTRAALARASDEDLFALANAARYRRRMDLARAALLAERRRFPSSPRALDAIFLLGRVDESYEGGKTRAIAWYDQYLARAPAGDYAAEALGRKMTLANEMGGPQEARPLAEEYLRRFPKGSYSGAAHALRGIP